LDTRTNLMWAAKDNGSAIDWQNAKSYCENYRGGGYADWRLPTMNELVGLYDGSKPRPAACYTRRSLNINVATELIDITCGVVFPSIVPHPTGNADSVVNIFFNFVSGRMYELISAKGKPIEVGRALPVRSVK
jgi:hypothetical protein